MNDARRLRVAKNLRATRILLTALTPGRTGTCSTRRWAFIVRSVVPNTLAIWLLVLRENPSLARRQLSNHERARRLACFSSYALLPALIARAAIGRGRADQPTRSRGGRFPYSRFPDGRSVRL